jgi:hypothetical protein
MNNHLNDGELRAALDGELGAEQLNHLEICSSCQSRQKMLETETRQIADKLAFLSSPAKDSRLASRTTQAWYRFNQRILTQKEIPMLKKLIAIPLVRYGLPILLALTLVFAFPTTRALASELLNLFRVQQVQAVPVDFTGLEQLTGDGALGNQFTELISNSVNITDEPGDPVEAADAAQASQLAGFNVRLPQPVTPSQIYVMDGASFSMTVERAKAQALLDEAGRGDLVLPESVDGADISVTIPASVSAAYGTCPKPEADSSESEDTERRYPDCVILAQIPSPSVNAPADLDINQLAQIGLEFTGMSAEEAVAFTGTVDWTSTLVVPIPSNAATYEQVTVDGVTGTLIQRASREGEPTTFALLWVKDGIIYAISGRGASSEQAIEMANSLP